MPPASCLLPPVLPPCLPPKAVYAAPEFSIFLASSHLARTPPRIRPILLTARSNLKTESRFSPGLARDENIADRQSSSVRCHCCAGAFEQPASSTRGMAATAYYRIGSEQKNHPGCRGWSPKRPPLSLGTSEALRTAPPQYVGGRYGDDHMQLV
jgi:hypothetical protein